MNKLSIYFSVMCSDTELGEQLYICGDIPELGNWIHGIKLYTNPNIYPQWKNQYPLYLNPQTQFQFKACIKDSSGTIRKWENLSQNRSLAPTSSIQIIFQYSNSNMSFNVEKPRQRAVSFRKVTMDNVEDLGEEENHSASSGWDQFVKKNLLEDDKVGNIDLVNEARFLYQNWKSETMGFSIGKRNELQEYKVRHVLFIKKQKNQLETAGPQQIEQDGTTVINYSKTLQIASTISRLNLQELFAFHFNLTDSYKSGILNIPTQGKGFLILYMSYNSCNKLKEENYDQLAEKAHILVANDYPILLKIIQMYQCLKYSVIMQSQNKFRVSLGEAKFFIFYHPQISDKIFNPTLIKSDAKSTWMCGHLDKIDYLLLGQRYLALPQKFRIQRLLSQQKNSQLQQGKNNICIVIHCESLCDFSMQVTTCLEKLGLKTNIQIYIMVDKKPTPQQIRKIMPLNGGKLIIIDLSGDIHWLKNKCNLFTQLSVEKISIQNYYQKIEEKIVSLLPKTDVNIVYQQNTMQITIKRNALTKIFLDWLNKQIVKLSSKLNLPMQVKRMKKLYENSNNYEHLQIKSILMSISFYCKIITSAIQHSNIQYLVSMYCLSFVNNSKFMKNMKKICEEKDIKMQSFTVYKSKNESKIQQQNGNGGISEDKLLELFQKIDNAKEQS